MAQRLPGSEFPVATMPLLTQHFAMMARNLVCAGTTRARKLLAMAGFQRALRIAVGRSQSRNRWTRLSYGLREAETSRPGAWTSRTGAT